MSRRGAIIFFCLSHVSDYFKRFFSKFLCRLSLFLKASSAGDAIHWDLDDILLITCNGNCFPTKYSRTLFHVQKSLIGNNLRYNKDFVPQLKPCNLKNNTAERKSSCTKYIANKSLESCKLQLSQRYIYCLYLLPVCFTEPSDRV